MAIENIVSAVNDFYCNQYVITGLCPLHHEYGNFMCPLYVWSLHLHCKLSLIPFTWQALLEDLHAMADPAEFRKAAENALFNISFYPNDF